MQKPETLGMRTWALSYTRADDEYRRVVRLCDYIDSFASHRCCETTGHEVGEVTIAQIREFVADIKNSGRHTDVHGSKTDWIDRQMVLNFIDSGPKKPTAREVISAVLRDTGAVMVGQTSFEIDAALRTAGLLKEVDNS